MRLTLAAQVGGRWYDGCGVRAPVLTGMALCMTGAVVWLVPLAARDHADPGQALATTSRACGPGRGARTP